jgi:hypothetical protein
MAHTGIIVSKAIFRGALPVKKLWSCNAVEMHDHFPYDVDAGTDHIDEVVAVVLGCGSSEEVSVALKASMSK